MMIVLFLMLGQVILLLGILGIIFRLIDAVVDKYNLKIRTRRNKKSRRSSSIPDKLLVLLNFDTAAAERLINHAKIKNPGKSKKWYTDKVIRDLERDRR